MDGEKKRYDLWGNRKKQNKLLPGYELKKKTGKESYSMGRNVKI